MGPYGHGREAARIGSGAFDAGLVLETAEDAPLAAIPPAVETGHVPQVGTGHRDCTRPRDASPFGLGGCGRSAGMDHQAAPFHTGVPS